MLNRLKLLYCQWRLRAAEQERAYWRSETERVAFNNSVAQAHIEYWKGRIWKLRYPVATTRRGVFNG